MNVLSASPDCNQEMLEFRIHGRGGQGIVVAASIFTEAVFLGGHYARAFSLFGAERRGAPVTAFIRTGTEKLMPRSRIYRPDYAVVFDSTLSTGPLFAGLKDSGMILVNADEKRIEQLIGELEAQKGYRLFRIDASEIAHKHGLTIGSFPMVNTVMLGAMGRVSGLASLEDLSISIRKRVTVSIEANLNAVADGFAKVEEVEKVVA